MSVRLLPLLRLIEITINGSLRVSILHPASTASLTETLYSTDIQGIVPFSTKVLTRHLFMPFIFIPRYLVRRDHCFLFPVTTNEPNSLSPIESPTRWRQSIIVRNYGESVCWVLLNVPKEGMYAKWKPELELMGTRGKLGSTTRH